MNNNLLTLFKEFIHFSSSLFSGKFDADHKTSESGQTLVEFMLLLFIIVFLSTFFMKIVNHNISIYWRYMVGVVVDDPKVIIKF